MVERCCLRALAVAVAALGPFTAFAQATTARNVSVRLGERLSHEDNLYRLPEGLDPAPFVGNGAQRDDTVSTTFVTLAGRWLEGTQRVVLDASAAVNRFASNGDLDNTSGRAALDWDWRFGRRWSGTLGGGRDRTLAGFADTLSLDKDLFDTTRYQSTVRIDAGPRWQATASAHSADTIHANPARRRDDLSLESDSVGVEYHTPRADRLGLEYTKARADYPEQALMAGIGSASDYDERMARLELGYVFTTKLALDASAGRIERRYALAPEGDFAGPVWNAALDWRPAESVRLGLRRYRELKAHVDAESDHFVASGAQVTASWRPVDKVELAFALSREAQRYIGADADPALAQRHDEPFSGSLEVNFVPREHAAFALAYRQESRGSNRLRFDYDAAALSLSAELRF